MMGETEDIESMGMIFSDLLFSMYHKKAPGEMAPTVRF
jgi:hypothetical protein